MQEHAAALAAAIEAALPGWVERSVARVMTAWKGSVDDDVRRQAAEAGRRAATDVGPEVRSLLAADIDDQRTTPLSIVRAAVRYPTEVLAAAGVPPLRRDEQQERLFPDDLYDLAPATFADVDPALAEVGLAWGAAKAYEHLQRHKVNP
ncbi:MAG TPA: hypothetical protein VG076_07405 [Acidimicrobiales bacterium]|nr:hypothetical protein [Acidimicrobiales bacterium]